MTEPNKSLNIAIEETLRELARASDYAARCQLQLQQARSNETEARNQVNVAQKELDRLYEEVRKQCSPIGSDWYDQRCIKHQA